MNELHKIFALCDQHHIRLTVLPQPSTNTAEQYSVKIRLSKKAGDKVVQIEQRFTSFDFTGRGKANPIEVFILKSKDGLNERLKIENQN